MCAGNSEYTRLTGIDNSFEKASRHWIKKLVWDQLVKDLKFPTKKWYSRKLPEILEKRNDMNKIDFQKITLDIRCRVVWRQKKLVRILLVWLRCEVLRA